MLSMKPMSTNEGRPDTSNDRKKAFGISEIAQTTSIQLDYKTTGRSQTEAAKDGPSLIARASTTTALEALHLLLLACP